MDIPSSFGVYPFEFIKTLYLFGKSDIPAAALPSMSVALVLAGPSSLHLVLEGFLWNQLHLLTFQVKNQIDGIEEDRIAKPHRPLPSGRITPDDARMLYHVLFIMMWVAAFYEKTISCTLIYSVAIVVYNEGGLAAIPVVKNVIGAIGLSCYCWGTTAILGMVTEALVNSNEHVMYADSAQDHGRELHSLKLIAVLMIGAIFATTGHAQDFRDRSADGLRGRKTIPLLLSQPVARWSLAVMTATWTLVLIALWRPPMVASIAFAIVCLRCLTGFVSSYHEQDDYVSYIWYGFWLLGGNLLPIFARMRGEMQ